MTRYSGLTTEEQAELAWRLALKALTRSGVPDKQARRFFGRLLSKHRITADRVLSVVAACEASGTYDAASYLARAVANRAADRANPGLLASWT